MAQKAMRDSALCLRFDLAPSFAQHTDVSNERQYVDLLLKLAADLGARLQFCASADWLNQDAGQLARIIEGGHAVDGYLSMDSRDQLGNTHPLEIRLAEMEEAFRRAKASWWGLGTTGLDVMISQKGNETAGLLMDRGYRWVSSHRDRQSGVRDREVGIRGHQPVMLEPDLVEIPVAGPTGFQLCAAGSSERSHNGSRGTLATLDHLTQAITAMIEEAAVSNLVCVISLPTGVFSSYDPEGHLVQELLARASVLEMPLVTLNEIADVALANTQAATEPRERVSMQQNLQYRDLWDRTIGPTQQPYKVYDYRGGWRLKPGFYRATSGKWEILKEPDTENGSNINQHGFRGAMFPHRKSSRERRMVVVGDSCVFGAAGDLTPWPAQIQLRLDELAGTTSFRVINAGIEGQSSVHCLMRMERLLTFEPDFMLIAVAANDLFIEDPADYVDTTGVQYVTSWEVVGEYPRERDVLNLVGGMRRPMTLAEFYPFSYDYHLREMVRACSRAGVIPLLMSLPCLLPSDMTLANEAHLKLMHHPPFVAEGDMLSMRRLYESYGGAVRRVAEEEQTVFINAEQFIARHYDDQRQSLFSDTCHPTSQGNKLIGRFVAERVWWLLSGDEDDRTDGP